VSATTILGRLGPFVRRDGALPVMASCLDWGARWAAGVPRARGSSARTFEYDGKSVPYFWHRYHHTWLTERAVEVALGAEVLSGHAPDDVVEVGNVLGHYLPTTHTVFDKYEQAEGVINQDVVDVAIGRQVDLVVSISTLEHVGLDEPVQDPDKPRRAIERLTSLLAPGGRLWVTIPLGYNLTLDRQLREGGLGFTKMSALRRISAANHWEQVALDDVWDATYDRLLYTAHGLVVAELVRQP
jgi:hypothetical protein